VLFCHVGLSYRTVIASMASAVSTGAGLLAFG
jgi:hypothetical protein